MASRICILARLLDNPNTSDSRYAISQSAITEADKDNNCRRVLVITYYWPPSAGSGVQRWLKTVKYLRAYGYEPVVYTVSNSQFELRDDALLAEIPEGIEVIREPIWEPFDLYNKFMGKGQKATTNVNPLYVGKGQQSSWKSRLAIWVRSNLFVPDTRMFFINPSVAYLVNYLKEHPVEAIVSTGPPHSMHVIALKLKRKLKKRGVNLPWLADFRDPWTQIGFYQELKLSSFARRKHESLEQGVLTEADAVVAVSHAMATDMDTLVKPPYKPLRTLVIHNGYDEADFVFEADPTPDKKFTITYVGMLGYPRNHQVFWQVLQELVQTNKDFAAALQLHFYGKVDPVVQESAQAFGLTPWLDFRAYQPHHQILETQRSSQVLLLMIDRVNNANGILTGKIFEYLALRRPVLCIGPEGGDAQQVLIDTGAGLFSGYDDAAMLKANILALFDAYQSGTPICQSQGYQQYSRKALAGKFAAVLDGLVGVNQSKN